MDGDPTTTTTTREGSEAKSARRGDGNGPPRCRGDGGAGGEEGARARVRSYNFGANDDLFGLFCFE